MEVYFKCCKNKETQNLYCIVCFEVFHRACIEKKKSCKELGGGKLYCSLKCEKKGNSHKVELDKALEKVAVMKKDIYERDLLLQKNEDDTNEEVVRLNSVIDQLKQTIEEHNNYIKRQNRRTRDFEDEAMERDVKDHSMLKEQNSIIEALNKKIIGIRETKQSYENDLKIRNDDLKLLEVELNRMEEINRILEQENTRYSRELTELKGQTDVIHPRTKLVADTKTYNDRNHEHICVDNKEEKAVEGNKNKILILCDEVGRKVGNLLRRELGQKYIVQSIIKSGASLRYVIEDMVQLTQSFTMNDFVIIQAGFNDFLSKSYPSFKMLNTNLKQSLNNTNVIVTTVPLKVLQLNFFINKFNDKLGKYITRLDNCIKTRAILVDINDNGHILTKNMLVSKLATLIVTGRQHSNLVHIVTHTSEYSNRDETGNDKDVIESNFLEINEKTVKNNA
ncbi:hypothetical protein JTB14_018308 [Gonioctena quinquepunctata]|nr:hypothetical protein JTB14_018308 [Gonioctena quinquepunctata]